MGIKQKKRPRAGYRPLLCCNKGSTIIEFAIVAPVFFLLFMGILEFSLILFTYSVLEGAAARASRVGLTGYEGPASAGGRIAYIRSEIMRLSGGYLDPGRLTVEILSYQTFAAIGQPEPCIPSTQPPPCPGQAGVGYIDVNGNNQWDADQGKAGAGDGNEIVHYRLHYPWAVLTPVMSNIIGGTYDVTALATVRNEGFE
ncbi:MAG: TadE/TadG family type IV pilus assembly protein [Alphaproteobacteria bacterium]